MVKTSNFAKMQIMERDPFNPGHELKLKCNICGAVIFGVGKLRDHKYKKHAS